MKNEIMPKCIGIIMDGNRRWARMKGLPTLEGHKAGLEKAQEVLRHAFERGVDTVVVYAFSTENWKRADGEVGYLMELFASALTDQFGEITKNGVEVRFIGDLSRLPEKLLMGAKKLEEDSRKNSKGKTLVVALSYGGRTEIVAGINKLLELGRENVSEKDVSDSLWSVGTPDPDLIIRTGGEKRISNFLTWQSVYSELFFSDSFWPDFTTAELDDILSEYAERERRHGK